MLVDQTEVIQEEMHESSDGEEESVNQKIIQEYSNMIST